MAQTSWTGVRRATSGSGGMHRHWVLVLIGMAGLSSLAPAQRRAEALLKPGVRVRYELPRASHAFSGRVEEVDTLRIVVRPEGTDLRIQLGLDSLRSLAVLEGIRSGADGAWRGMKAGFQIGILVGAVATTAVWLSPADERCDDCYFSVTAATGVISVLGTLGLSLLGAALGASAPGEVWTPVPIHTAGRPRP